MSKEFENTNDEELFHVQEKASYVLGQVLEEELEGGPKKDLVDVRSALSGQKFTSIAGTERSKSRLLVVTDDLNILDENSSQHAFYKNLANQFEELHVIIAASLRQSRKLSQRYGNLWLYTTGHLSWLRAPGAVKRVAREQLTFGGGFRPDFVFSTNPYEAGWGAYRVAQKHDRPFVLEVQEEFWTEYFRNKDKTNRWRQRIAGWVLLRANSVRVPTKTIFEYLKTTYPKIKDVDVLPRYHNIKEIKEEVKNSVFEDAFPRFALVFLFVGRLDHRSTLYRTIDAVRDQLYNERNVLVVVGDGPAKEEFKERAKIFGVDKNIVFKPENTDIVSLMKSADVFICTDTNEESDDVVLKAAAVGSSLVIAKTSLREDIFTQDEDAYLCDPEDTVCFTKAVKKMADDVGYRNRLKETSEYTVQTRLHEDSETFYQAYRNSLERVFNVVNEEVVQKQEVSASPKEVGEEVVNN